MDTNLDPPSAASAIAESRDAIISIRFFRLWDLLSPSQRQYALHLARPSQYEHVPDEPSPYTRAEWDHLPAKLRLAILAEFAVLPDVLSIELG